MNVFGVGAPELLVILLVAFIALGPGKTIEVARTIGRMTREARRAFNDIVDAASLSGDGGSRREQRNSTHGSAPPGQPPSDPLPMPPHLQSSADQAAPQPEGADPETPANQR